MEILEVEWNSSARALRNRQMSYQEISFSMVLQFILCSKDSGF